MAKKFNCSGTIIFLLIILGISVFFRLWQLNSIPPGLYPDVAINGNEAISNPGKVFYPENHGREGLMINLIALSFSIFGISIWSIKIVAAVIGILTVLGLYLLTKEIFQSQNYISPRHPRGPNESLGGWRDSDPPSTLLPSAGTSGRRPAQRAGPSSIVNSQFVALLSSFFLAVSFWHVNFSRIGFRGILVPFVLVFAFYFLFRAFRLKKLSDFILSGIFWGLGFYTYTPFRIAVLILIIFLTFKLIEYLRQFQFQKSLKWWWNKMYLQDGWWKVDIFILVIILVALPIGIYFLQNPQDFIGRVAPISIFAAKNPIKEFGKSLILHLGMFNFYGDSNWRHNFSGSPQLFWPIGILFLFGIVLSIKKLIISIKTKNYSLLTVHCSLLGWFLVMLLPGILTYEGIPHALRTIGVIPVVYIFAGLGGWKSYQYFHQNVKNKKLLVITSVIFLVMVGVFQFNKYFIKWSKRPEMKGAFSTDYEEIGNYLNSLPAATQKYVIVNQPGVPVPWPNGLPMPAQTVMFVENTKFGSPQSTYLLPENIEQVKIKKETVIIPMRYDEDLFNEFLRKFPQGEIQEKNGIWVYKINF